jgi:hypothetical protein
MLRFDALKSLIGPFEKSARYFNTRKKRKLRPEGAKNVSPSASALGLDFGENRSVRAADPGVASKHGAPTSAPLSGHVVIQTFSQG